MILNDVILAGVGEPGRWVHCKAVEAQRLAGYPSRDSASHPGRGGQLTIILPICQVGLPPAAHRTSQ